MMVNGQQEHAWAAWALLLYFNYFQVSDLFSTPGDHVGITDAEVAAGVSTGPETDPGGGLKRSGRNFPPPKNGREKLKIGSLTIEDIIYIYVK